MNFRMESRLPPTQSRVAAPMIRAVVEAGKKVKSSRLRNPGPLKCILVQVKMENSRPVPSSGAENPLHGSFEEQRGLDVAVTGPDQAQDFQLGLLGHHGQPDRIGDHEDGGQDQQHAAEDNDDPQQFGEIAEAFHPALAVLHLLDPRQGGQVIGELLQVGEVIQVPFGVDLDGRGQEVGTQVGPERPSRKPVAAPGG